jgi:flagellar biosynthesis protein FliR
MAPQMHVFTWGMPLRIVVGLAAMVVYLPELILACSRSILSRQGSFLFE